MNLTARPGLTLIEMLVVLTILAVLTTLAVSATSGAVDQARFDATQRQLQNLKDAVVGPAGLPDAPSFVGDLGRLPEGYVDPADPTGEVQLAELWSNPSPNPNDASGLPLPAFGPRVALDPTQAGVPVDAGVSVLCGWRGPYVSLPPGQTRLRDGWGNPFAFLQPDGLTAVSGTAQPIGQAHSAGGPAAPYNQLQALPTALVSGSPSHWSGVNWTGTVSGSVAPYAPTNPLPPDVTVLLYVPDATKASTGFVRVMAYRARAAGGYGFQFPVPSTDPNYAAYVNSAAQPLLADSLLPVPVGPKALRVYPYSAPASYWQGPLGATSASGTVYLSVPPGGATRTLYYGP